MIRLTTGEGVFYPTEKTSSTRTLDYDSESNVACFQDYLNFLTTCVPVVGTEWRIPNG